MSDNFAADVLDIIQRRKVTFRGLKPDYLEIFIDGSAKMWFYGHENGKPVRKGITVVNNGACSDAVHFGDSNIMAQLIEEGIDHAQARFY